MQEDLPKRKQIRLKDYDYSQNGYYFVTICTYKKKNLFGIIDEGKMVLNDIGNIVDFTWNDLINHNDIKLHQYVIMPNHIHGIIEICNGCRERSVTVPQTSNHHYGIPEIIRQLKTFSSKRINEFLKRNGYEPFPTIKDHRNIPRPFRKKTVGNIPIPFRKKKKQKPCRERSVTVPQEQKNRRERSVTVPQKEKNNHRNGS